MKRSVTAMLLTIFGLLLLGVALWFLGGLWLLLAYVGALAAGTGLFAVDVDRTARR